MSSVLSRESGRLTRAIKPAISSGHLSVTKRRVEAALAEPVIGLTSANLIMGGITRPRDLRGITRSTGGHLERNDLVQSLSPDTDTVPVPEHAIGFFHESDESVITNSPVLGNFQRRSTPHTDAFHNTRSPQLSLASQQTRGFHTSSRVPYDSSSYNMTDVPDFFTKYKQRGAISLASSDVHEDLGLMPSLTRSILSGDVVASTRRLQAKVPVEHHVAEGHIIHPSGFVVPGPGHTSTSDVARAKERERNENIDRAIQTAAVAHRVLESDFEEVDATTLPSSHKVPFEVREPDGTVKHPSGFVPPTPAHKFRHIVNTNMLRERKVSSARQRVVQPSPARAVLRAMHTAVPTASEDS